MCFEPFGHVIENSYFQIPQRKKITKMVENNIMGIFFIRNNNSTPRLEINLYGS